MKETIIIVTLAIITLAAIFGAVLFVLVMIWLDRIELNDKSNESNSTWLKDAKRRKKYRLLRRVRFILLARYYIIKRKLSSD